MISGMLPHRVKEIHKKYGNIVRIAPDELSFTLPNTWRDVYPRNFVRPHQFKGKPPGKEAENLISANESDHARFRKILAPAFSERSLQQQETLVQRYIDLLIGKLQGAPRGRSSGPTVVVDLLEWFNYTTFDIIGQLTWGSSFGCLQEQRYHTWIQVILQFKIALVLGALKFFPPLNSLLMLLRPQSAIMDMWKTTEEKVAQRLAMDTEGSDIISHILAANHSSSELVMSREEIEINAMLIVVAGSESVTTVLTGIVNHLLRNPDKLNVLVREIRASFQDEDQITGTSATYLPYLGAVLKEGLRLCPTIPDGMRRLIPKGGAGVAGHFLPEGVVVSIPQWAAYQSPSNFHSPASFVPERWLGGASKVSSPFSRDRKDVFNPFSMGPHNCPGRALAWLEMRLILARLLWNFDIQIPKGIALPVWGKQKIYWFWDKQAIKVSMCHTAGLFTPYPFKF